MSWKKSIALAVLTAAVGTTAVSAATAATPKKDVITKAKPAASVAVNVTDTKYMINGKDVMIHTVSINGKSLASVRMLADALGADVSFDGKTVQVDWNGHTVKLATNSDQITADGVQQQLSTPVKKVENYNYIELEGYLQGLGAALTTDGAGGFWIDEDLLKGADHVQWIGNGRLIASQTTESGVVNYDIDAKSGAYGTLLNNPNASDLAVSADGKQAAYTDNTGAVYVIDLATKVSKQVSADSSIKPELVWSADGSAIYFLQGDKGSTIAKLDVATGTVSKVLDDKVDYKSNLNVSSDGKTFNYVVTVAPKVTAPGDKAVEDDDVTIDDSAAAANIFQFVVDSAVKDVKAVQLTSTNDDKMYVKAAVDGSSVTYVSVPADEKAKSVLVKVSKDKTVKTVFGDPEVLQAVSVGDKWYVLTSGPAGSNLIYEVDAAGASKQLYTVSGTVSEIIAWGSSIAIGKDGAVFAQLNGQWRPVSR